MLFKDVDASSAELNMGVADINSPVFANADGRILLGTFEFTGLSLGTTNIGVTDLTVDVDDIISGLGNPLDGLISAGSGEVAVVPEPGSVALSLVLLGGAAVVTAVRRRRRRHAKDMTNRTLTGASWADALSGSVPRRTPRSLASRVEECSSTRLSLFPAKAWVRLRKSFSRTMT